MKFTKYHALGNDYLVLDPKDCPELPSAKDMVTICHRNFGLGSDGILYGPEKSEVADFKLRIINPDASEAEKSGNGIRIFSRYLYDNGFVAGSKEFTLETLGGVVKSKVEKAGKHITVEMGRVTFEAEKIPVSGPNREVINETFEILGNSYTYCCAGIGNPHCVLPMEKATEELAKKIGPAVENHPLFPNRINMQLLEVLDRGNIKIEIWERGAGYTLASGSSSSAAAAVARRLGLVDSDVTVHMPGGEISIKIDDDFNVTMAGPTTKVGVYEMDSELLLG